MRVHSDNIQIRASNRLAQQNLKSTEETQNLEQDVHEGRDTFGVTKAVGKAYGVTQDISKAGGLSAYGKDALATTKGAAIDTFSGLLSRSTPGAVKSTATAAAAADAGAKDFSAVAGEVLSKGGKALGTLGAGVDVYEDITHGGLYGNTYEKVANVLTIASTVADFVPGMEAVGVVGTLAASVIGAIGDHEEAKDEDDTDQAEKQSMNTPLEQATQVTVSQSAPDASRSQMPSSGTF